MGKGKGFVTMMAILGVASRMLNTIREQMRAAYNFATGGWRTYAEQLAEGTWHVVAVPMLKIILVSIIFAFVVLSSTAMYIAFYQLYVPALGASYPVHFDFTDKTTFPTADIPITLV